MSRSTPEWIGASDDSPIPPRVRLRIFLRFDGRCQCGCGRRIAPGEAWQADHIVALVNGGQNRESNLHPLLTEHHKNKTRADVAEKSRVYVRAAAHVGIKLRSSGRSFPCGRNTPFKRKVSGEVVRR